MLGFSYDKPARHMKEYLEVLAPLCRGEAAKYAGEQYKVAAQLQVPGATRVPILVAALGPVMLKLTGRLADGTITWMTGPKTLAAHIIPVLREAAKVVTTPAGVILRMVWLPSSTTKTLPAASVASTRCCSRRKARRSWCATTALAPTAPAVTRPWRKR